MMHQIAALPAAQLAVLAFIILGFLAFGITLLTLSISAALDENARKQAPAPRTEVTPARREPVAS